MSVKDDNKKNENYLFEPFFGEYQIFFTEQNSHDLANKGKIHKYWNLSTEPSDIVKSPCALKFINGYIPKYSQEDEYDDRIISSRKSDSKNIENIDHIVPGDPKTFNHISCMAKMGTVGNYQGIEALGVFKADVDFLGLIMSCGLQEKRFTLSRLATLSRQMNYYFAVYLPHFLETNKEFSNIYTVFSGGDDCFLIGPWNKIIDFTDKINKSFSNYVCLNKDIHISVGITLHKPHTPINTMAESAESSLKKSKNEGRDRITLFNETVTRNELNQLIKIEK